MLEGEQLSDQKEKELPDSDNHVGVTPKPALSKPAMIAIDPHLIARLVNQVAPRPKVVAVATDPRRRSTRCTPLADRLGLVTEVKVKVWKKQWKRSKASSIKKHARAGALLAE